MYGLKAWQEPGPNSHTQARACPVQALRHSASPRTGPEAYQGKGKQGQGPEKGLTPQGGGGRVIHKQPRNICGK